jgi:hypothetical protein
MAKTLFRFPFLANEIFNTEVNSLLDKFFDAPEKISKPVTTTSATSERSDDAEPVAAAQ